MTNQRMLGRYEELVTSPLTLLKNGPAPASFSFIFGLFQTNITNICEKMSIQYTVPGFEPTTFGT